MTTQRATAQDDLDLLTDGFVAKRSEIVRCARAGVQRVVAAQLAGGHAVFSSGVGDNADQLFMQTPDGCRVHYRVGANGMRETVHDTVQ